MAMPIGRRKVGLNVSIPIPVFKLLNDDAVKQFGHSSGKVSTVISDILSKHYKKDLAKLSRKEKNHAR
jgi:hypothetical protein